MDVSKAMLARIVRKHTGMGLVWISATREMGVRSSVTRAEKELQRKMANDKKLQKQWRELENASYLFLEPIFPVVLALN
jgi:hypothetical protein